MMRRENPLADFDVVSMPEFLREGFATHDFFNPDRIVIGTDSPRALEVMDELCKPFEGRFPILRVSRRSGEMIKYASNAFLATKIQFINEIADLCEKIGASIGEVARGIGMDSRIGSKFLQSGPGYGGSCFPKDTKAMISMGQENGVSSGLLKCVVAGNEARKMDMARRILECLGGIPTQRVAMLGLAFKGGTDECRESPAIEIIERLIEKGVKIIAYDPKAMTNARVLLGDSIEYAPDAYAAIKGADLLVIATEWDEFCGLDLKRIKSSMKNPKIFDMRNLIDINSAKALGFSYRGIGMGCQDDE
jgi:UDPglucose 6-dehydrogenase